MVECFLTKMFRSLSRICIYINGTGETECIQENEVESIPNIINKSQLGKDQGHQHKAWNVNSLRETAKSSHCWTWQWFPVLDTTGTGSKTNTDKWESKSNSRDWQYGVVGKLLLCKYGGLSLDPQNPWGLRRGSKGTVIPLFLWWGRGGVKSVSRSSCVRGPGDTCFRQGRRWGLLSMYVQWYTCTHIHIYTFTHMYTQRLKKRWP